MVKSSGWMQIYRASKAIDHSYIHLILQGKRRPHRDVLISLCMFGWSLDPIETDTILLLGGYPPLGRSVRRESGAHLGRRARPNKEMLDDVMFCATPSAHWVFPHSRARPIGSPR